MSEHGYCDKCGKDLGDHPTVNVEGINTLALCQERAIKWQRVEPGYVIPAGQPYRVEPSRDTFYAAVELVGSAAAHEATETGETFVDSSWKPPLVVPTEPTWGIAVGRYSVGFFAKWVRDGEHLDAGEAWRPERWLIEDVLDFIPLTDEQVARIEAAR